ncbi:hypothetical protein DASC09_040570 [Saccharomycopsis crataegensis]|uniref:Major facilitator superfamily (MFS) profile domain-containing protein n=1 Tax=Saccharomycopsis crataegensis TaxID=43959 RepID=A0AAV5QPH2_9ASCO|nr:hypothetical protein DASC09_040570 [Saccharomycopsis crataegensis]
MYNNHSTYRNTMIFEDLENHSEIEKETKNNTLEFQVSQISDQHNEFILSFESKNLKVDALAQELEIDQSRLMRKVDLCVLLPIFILFYVANLNRANFGLLELEGITTTLKISQLQYYGAVAVFFAPYVVFQSFSNLVLKSIRPHFWMSTSVLIYGCVVLGTAFVRDYPSLLACQFLHGLFQSGCDSAVFYILSNYYERSESQKRVSFIYSAAALGVLTNNLMGSRLRVDKVGSSIPFWSWILIIDAAITIGSAFILFFILPDFPEGNRFLEDNETLFIVKKLEIHCGKSGYNIKYSFKNVIDQLKDPMILLPVFISTFFGAITYGFNFMEPLAFGLYFGPQALVRGTWPWLCGFFVVCVFGYFSDLMRCRYPLYFLSVLFAVYGLAVARFDRSLNPNDTLRYSSVFFSVMGAHAAFPMFIGWATFNLNGHLRKSIITSLMICSYDLGGIYSTFIIYNNDVLYTQAETAAFAFSLAAFFFSLCYLYLVHRENAKKRTPEYKVKYEQLSKKEKILAGDRDPSFDYIS